MEKEVKDLIVKLDNFKKKHNFTYEQIAYQLETTPRTLNRWITGAFQPLPIYQRKITEFLESWGEHK